MVLTDWAHEAGWTIPNCKAPSPPRLQCCILQLEMQYLRGLTLAQKWSIAALLLPVSAQSKLARPELIVFWRMYLQLAWQYLSPTPTLPYSYAISSYSTHALQYGELQLPGYWVLPLYKSILLSELHERSYTPLLAESTESDHRLDLT